MNVVSGESFRRAGLAEPRTVGVLGIAGTRFDVRADQPVALAPFLAAHRHFAEDAEGGRVLVHVLAAGSHACAPRIRFPEMEMAAVRGLIDRGPTGRFEPLHGRDGDPVVLYRDRQLELTPAVALSPDGCDVLEPRLLGSYLELLLLNAALDRAPHLAAAHAAVVARGEQAALICGGCGAGKTTLTLALLRHGCAYLSDEVALLDPIEGTVRAYPRSLGLRDGTLALLGSAALGPGSFQATSLAGDRKWFADPGTAAPAGIRATARLRHVWFLTGFASAPQVSDADPWSAAQQLARSMRRAHGGPMERLWAGVEIARQCHVREVVAGPPEATAVVLARLMDQEGGAAIT
jgi:hypothetical protein